MIMFNAYLKFHAENGVMAFWDRLF